MIGYASYQHDKRQRLDYGLLRADGSFIGIKSDIAMSPIGTVQGGPNIYIRLENLIHEFDKNPEEFLELHSKQ